jgi:hypothetical protein
MSCDGLTLVLPPQQPVSNAMMEQVQRWGKDISNNGLDAIEIKKVKQFFVGL